MVEHRQEILRALRFVNEHLTEPMTVADVAKAAHLSEFHLHRVFHAEVGESVGRFITRRRLEIAALRLAYEPRLSITEVALSSGYSSSSNFAKAFRAYFGCSPTAIRDPQDSLPRSIGALTERHGKTFRPEDLYTLPPETRREDLRREAARWNACVRFVDADAMPFACLASDGGYGFEAVEDLWATLIARARQLGLADHEVDAWGIAHDSPNVTAPELCRYHACVPCPPDHPLPPPLFHGERSAGRYAVFDYAGAVTELADAYRSIYSCWFRESSVSPADFVPLDHYVTDEPVDGRIQLELWIRVSETAA